MDRAGNPYPVGKRIQPLCLSILNPRSSILYLHVRRQRYNRRMLKVRQVLAQNLGNFGRRIAVQQHEIIILLVCSYRWALEKLYLVQ